MHGTIIGVMVKSSIALGWRWASGNNIAQKARPELS
jgi:hypothetical protein